MGTKIASVAAKMKKGYIKKGFEKESGSYFAYYVVAGNVAPGTIGFGSSKKSQEEALVNLCKQLGNKLALCSYIISILE